MNTDRIEKQILLRASLDRVWRAISDSSQFGYWFGVAFEAPFTPGAYVPGKITPTQVDPAVAKLQEPHTGKKFEFWIERIEPMHSIAFRWHPYAIAPDQDYTQEPTTLIVFTLRAEGEHTHLTITESGFDKLPLERRATALKANDGGWSHQILLIQNYLALHSQR
jgi:uncharacterized protein YndB with AHSA1/START domain